MRDQRSRWSRALRGARAHLARLRYRLLVVNLIVVAVPVIGIAFARLHERQLLAALERDLHHQATALAIALDRTPADGWSTLVDRTGAATGARFEVVDAAGALVAGRRGEGGPGAPREVRAALADRYGAATRITPDRRRVELFVAVPRRAADGQVTGAIRASRSTAPVMRQLVALRHRLFEVLLIGLALTAAVSLFLAATIARPLAALTRRAERIAAGDRPARLALDREDEIGQLSRAVDRMADELERRTREQRDLAADLSHELKTPLAAIRGAAELLADDDAIDPADRARFLAMILADAARLDRLASRLLELSRVEVAQEDAAPVELTALTRAVMAHAPPPPAVVLVAPHPLEVVVRADAVATAVDNLITNARQHARPGTTITVTLAEVDRRVRVAVHNHGAPISPAVQAKVWRRFFTTRAVAGGSGLGLAIVRAVAAAHGGEVGVTSSIADGTTFWFELTTDRAAATSRG